MENQGTSSNSPQLDTSPVLHPPASLLGLPFELRNVILKEVVPHKKTVKLSTLQSFYWRSSWKHGNRRRCDPPILSVCKQLYDEASQILYDCNFVIDVGCVSSELNEVTWNDTNITGIFPFHKARKVTLTIIARVYEEPDHLFHHMVSICGILLSEAKSIKELSIELETMGWTSDRINSACQSWRDTGNKGFSERFGLVAGTKPDHWVEHIAFFLQPLALPGHINKCKITLYTRHVWCADSQILDQRLEDISGRYERALTDKSKISYEESEWIWDEYMSIKEKQEQCKRRDQQEKVQKHQEWLQHTNEHNHCKHSGFGKKYTRSNGKKAQCEGCEHRYTWLTECRKCWMRACTRCKSELKEKRAEGKAIDA